MYYKTENVTVMQKGRIALPQQFRENMELKEGDTLIAQLFDDVIRIKKPIPERDFSFLNVFGNILPIINTLLFELDADKTDGALLIIDNTEIQFISADGSSIYKGSSNLSDGTIDAAIERIFDVGYYQGMMVEYRDAVYSLVVIPATHGITSSIRIKRELTSVQNALKQKHVEDDLKKHYSNRDIEICLRYWGIGKFTGEREPAYKLANDYGLSISSIYRIQQKISGELAGRRIKKLLGED